MVCEGTSLLFFTKNKSNKKIASLRKIINGNINVICYDLKGVVPPCLRSITHNDYSTISPLRVRTEEHDNIMYKNNKIEGIEFSIGMQYTTCDYNDEFWDYI